MQDQTIAPIHPGEILLEEILIPRQISPADLAAAINYPREIIEWVCQQRMGINSDLAARLSLYFNTSVNLWINLQTNYENKLMQQKSEQLIAQIQDYITPYAPISIQI